MHAAGVAGWVKVGSKEAAAAAGKAATRVAKRAATREPKRRKEDEVERGRPASRLPRAR